MSKRSVSNGPANGQISAFAAAKAKRAAQQLQIESPATEPGLVVPGGTLPATRADKLELDPLSRPGSDVDHDSLSEDGGPPPKRMRLQHSSFDAHDLEDFGDRIALRLGKGSFITCTGIYDLTVTTGAVEVHGAHFEPDETQRHRVYAPYGHGLPTIVSVRDDTGIVLSSVDCGLPALERLSPLWRKVWHKPLPPKSFDVLDHSFGDLPFQTRDLRVQGEPLKALIKLARPRHGASPPVVLVTGAKGSGKSTFCRSLLNTLITTPDSVGHCFWLDLDPGQPEFGVPGQISLVQAQRPLLGPPYTHAYTGDAGPYTTVAAHVIGANSPREDVEHYLACALDLHRRYKDRTKTGPPSPLVINSPGWITGSGATILQRLVGGMTLTDLVVLEPSDSPDIDTRHMLAQASPRPDLTPIRTATRFAPARPASEFRAMQQMSYFHALPSSRQAAWSARPLASAPALTLSFDDALLAGILPYHDPLPLPHLPTILDKMPLFLVSCPAPSAFPLPPARSPDIPYLHPPSTPARLLPPLNPRHSTCIGQALLTLRPASRTLSLATPVPAAVLRAAGRVVLVRPKGESPDWAFAETVRFGGAVGEMERGAEAGLVGVVGEAGFDLSEEEDDEGEEPPYVAVRSGEGGGVGRRVWRPRYLPRNGR